MAGTTTWSPTRRRPNGRRWRRFSCLLLAARLGGTRELGQPSGSRRTTSRRDHASGMIMDPNTPAAAMIDMAAVNRAT